MRVTQLTSKGFAVNGRGCRFQSFGSAMSRKVTIYDTTLRDGTRGEGISFSSADKVRIAERLDAFGIHYIEGGWPGGNPKDMEFFAAVGCAA